MPHRLSSGAAQDLVEIHAEGVELFGPRQADAYVDRLEAAFDLLAATPGIARERTELSPPVRAYPCGAHVVVFETEADGILILRVRHGYEDWMGDPLG